MKACRVDTLFRPVTLTLESQAEVDAVFAVLNHTQVCEALGIGENDFAALEPFRSMGYDALHCKLTALFK